MSIPNIVLFTQGRTWEFELDAYVASDGWAITARDLMEEAPEDRTRIVEMFSDYFKERHEREAARLSPKPEIEHARVYAWKGKWYVVRDVWDYGGLGVRYSYAPDCKLLRCENGIKQPDGSIVWLPCEEGSAFEAMSPFTDG